MTDRDRLAADLAANPVPWNEECDPKEPGWITATADYMAQADRLIALGWTRLDAATDLGQQTVVSTALGRRVTEKPLVLHADQCALAPDHGGPCMWVGGRRPEDPVYPNRRAADLRGIVTDPAWAEGHRRGDDIDEERLARALADRRTWTCPEDCGDSQWGYCAHEIALLAKVYREDTDAHD